MKLLRLAVAVLPLALLAATPAPDVNQLGAIVKAREQRTNLLRDELKAQDARIEARIDAIVTGLAAISDSKDSRTKVTRLKETTADGLRKNLEYFRQKRSVLIQELRSPTWRLTDEQKQKGIAAFDARIEKRVAQILALQKSLPTHKDYARYNVHDGGDWGPSYSASEEFRQNQRLTAHTNAQRSLVEAGLRKSIARLEQQNRTLLAQRASSAEIVKNEALIAERRQQLAEVFTFSTTPTREIGRKEAADLDSALRKAADELRREFVSLFARYNALIPELSALNAARDAAAAAKH